MNMNALHGDSSPETSVHTARVEVAGESRLVNEVHSFSLASERHPERNEDNFLVDTTANMYGVFDGVGGYVGGEIASETAKEVVAERAKGVDTFASLDAASEYLRGVLHDANDAILESTDGAATTAVLVKVHELNGELFASVAHIGDSRAYLLRGGTLDGGILQTLTTDHTPFRFPGHTQEAMSQQERLADVDNTSVLSTEDSIAFRKRNIIGACLGRDDEVRVDVKHFLLQRGDTLILTTDGVHDNLSSTEIHDLLIGADPVDYAKVLVHAANHRANEPHRRAKMDDITAVVVAI